MILGYTFPQIRKAALAAVAAVITVLHAFNVPVAEDVSTKAVAIVDALLAVLVFVVPNDG